MTTYRPTTTRNEFLQVLRAELLCFDGLDFLWLQTYKVSIDVTRCYTSNYVEKTSGISLMARNWVN